MQFDDTAIRPAPGKGRGLFALRDFEEGEVITYSAATRFEGADRDAVHGAMGAYDFTDREDDRAVLVAWGPSTMVNHSDTPNAVFLQAKTDNGHYVYLVAARLVMAGEEICHAYANAEEYSFEPFGAFGRRFSAADQKDDL